MSIVTIYSFLIEAINEAGQDFLVSSINYKQTSKTDGVYQADAFVLMEVPPFGQLVLELGINPKTLSSQSDQIVMSKTGSRLLAVTYKSGQYDSFHFKTAIVMNLLILK
ncbi:hypothetical protein [Limosilactobacillus reuteri]|uniref:hypothetical protein n=1 Tax=Limosilactobacillus reuteri TaxID=1598 RepID=UPI001F23E1A2|nr:hypothetical protein [Limosilactobacillus reuteri]